MTHTPYPVTLYARVLSGIFGNIGKFREFSGIREFSVGHMLILVQFVPNMSLVLMSF